MKHEEKYPMFIRSLTISGIRGWGGKAIEFRSPFVALVGKNGTGKSTILKAAACMYETDDKQVAGNHKLSQFFRDTPFDKVENVSVECKITHHGNEFEMRFKKRKSDAGSNRFRRVGRAYKRPVVWLDISRVTPKDALAGYAKLASKNASEIANDELDEDFRKELCHILGREYSNAKHVRMSGAAKKHLGVLKTNNFEYSQFHQGAGEGATHDLMRLLSGVPENALILIDEIETALHPAAQRQLVRLLLKLSRAKKWQFIVTTHSGHVLDELRPESKVLLRRNKDGEVEPAYGPSNSYALSEIDDYQVHHELEIYVEDDIAAIFLKEILRSGEEPDILKKVHVKGLGAVSVLVPLAEVSDRLEGAKKLVVLDGDAEKVDKSKQCRRVIQDGSALLLPGKDAPEIVVFQWLKEKGWGDMATGYQDIKNSAEAAMLDTDHHEWPKGLANRLRVTPDTIWTELVREFLRLGAYPEDMESLCRKVKSRIGAGAGGSVAATPDGVPSGVECANRESRT